MPGGPLYPLAVMPTQIPEASVEFIGQLDAGLTFDKLRMYTAPPAASAGAPGAQQSMYWQRPEIFPSGTLTLSILSRCKGTGEISVQVNHKAVPEGVDPSDVAPTTLAPVVVNFVSAFVTVETQIPLTVPFGIDGMLFANIGFFDSGANQSTLVSGHIFSLIWV